ncbi:MAG: zinc ribbon domain-containing protein [Anaerobacillus sp.]|uniref:zinc ribbon domain-containing protein n=1 Tax=Anaerobacillus sp. TaxID=1872506 RepID=UPI00391BB88B
MGQEKFIPEQHLKKRSLFRFLGPIFLLIGLGCMIIAFIDFFTLQGFEEPKYFWLFFVGMPFLFVGFSMSGLGYGSSVAKYQSREYAPVVKDTFNYLAKETTSGVVEVSKAIQQGSSFTQSTICHSCHQQNDIHAKFCVECGEKLAKVCSRCKKVNINEARFCNECGNSIE